MSGSPDSSSRARYRGIPNLDQVMLGASEEPNLGLYTLVKGSLDVCFDKGRRSADETIQ